MCTCMHAVMKIGVWVVGRKNNFENRKAARPWSACLALNELCCAHSGPWKAAEGLSLCGTFEAASKQSTCPLQSHVRHF